MRRVMDMGIGNHGGKNSAVEIVQLIFAHILAVNPIDNE